MSCTAILAADKNIIPYRKELNAITGGVTSSILLQQISYWWVQSGRKAFYKFIEPCAHEKYSSGDSWTEELGFTRKEFITAIKRLEAAGFVSKKTNASRVTVYTLHEDCLSEAMGSLYKSESKGFTKSPKGDLPKAQKGFTKSPKEDLPLYTETTTETTTDIKSIEQQAARPASASRFEEWWKIYPVKRGKKAAQATWRRKKLDRIADDIIADTRNRIANDGQWLKGYIPHGSTYVSQEVWLDDTTAPNQLRPDIIDSRDICNACGAHRNDCVCWAENLHEDLF